jgi:hypothetical protein
MKEAIWVTNNWMNGRKFDINNKPPQNKLTTLPLSIFLLHTKKLMHGPPFLAFLFWK